MRKHFKHTLKFTGLLLVAVLAIAACSLPTQTAEPNPPATATVATSESVVSATSMPAAQAEIEEEIVVEEVEEIEETEEEADAETLEEAGTTTAPAVTENDSVGISETERAGLIYMREEEKLALDVYLALYDLWGLPLFQNIAGSEQTHTDAVKNLLDIYAIPDPADQSAPGIFQDQTLQGLYDQLVEQGATSLGEALKVGAAIEEIDILDLQEYLLETNNPEVQRVYENLLKGSENHLRAFTSTFLQQTGETYQPQFMDADAYDTVLANAPARGNQNSNRRP